ncbi:MAG: hypothetical protein ABSA16_11600 [Thermoguttaceae bacterium]
MPHGNRSQFALAKAGQNQCFIDQGAFAAEPFKVNTVFITQLSDRFASPLTPANSHCIHQRPAACYIKQADKFVFGQSPAFAAGVDFFISLRYLSKRIK